MPPRKLRIGIMCQGPVLQRWQAIAVERMLASGLVELSLIILDDPANYPPLSLWSKIRRAGPSRILFNLYLRTLFRPRSMRTQDMSDVFADIPRVSCVAEKRGRWSQHFCAADLDAIRARDLDMILRFGFNIIRGEVLEAARYGVWSFHHDDELKYRGGPPCYWEIHEGDPETGAILQRLTDRLDGGIVLKKGIFRTKRHSYARNLDQAYFESAKWPARVCRDIANGTADYLNQEPSGTSAPVRRLPTNGQFLLTLARMAAAWVRQAIYLFAVFNRWNVALVKLPIHALLDAAGDELRSAIGPPLKLRNGRSFNADAFGLPMDGGFAVLFEELDESGGGQGKLVAAMLDASGTERARFVPEGLPAGNHASYPFLFRHDGHVYLLPETAAESRIALFRADEFPRRWTHVADLLAGERFADPTLVRHEGRFWLFYTIHSEEFDGDLHLHLAFAERIEGPYAPHPANPVKVSARSSRPAGTPFVTPTGDLIRPAQNFCRTYGGSVVFNRVKVMTPDRYEEEEVGKLHPFDCYYRDGLHTIAALDDGHCLIDMKRHVLRWPWR